jgi:cytochrome c553
MKSLKGVRYQCTLCSVILTVTSLACAQVPSDPPRIVVRYCSGCHGLNGESQLRYVPRLAGMETAYLLGRFATYRGGAEPPIDEMVVRVANSRPVTHSGWTTAAEAEMLGVARRVSNEDAKAAIDWYASRQAVWGKRRNAKTYEEGERLYTSGLQSKGLQACQGCHGPEARGHDIVPRLAGQNAAYEAHALATYLQSR